jgi:Domain of Unknown Function (DUF1259)
MRTIDFERDLSVRGLLIKILLTMVTATSLYCGSLAAGQTTSSTSVNGADDWKPVEAAMGRARQMQPGDVIKSGMPRKDLHVVLDGVDIKPSLALGSWATDAAPAAHPVVLLLSQDKAFIGNGRSARTGCTEVSEAEDETTRSLDQ